MVAPGLPLVGKISLFLLVVVSLTALALAWVGQQIVLQQFGATESELVMRNRQVLLQAIQVDVDSVSTAALDWSQWNDLYDHAQGSNPGFAGEEVTATALDRLKLDAMQVLGSGGQLVSEVLRSGGPAADGQTSSQLGAEIRQAAAQRMQKGAMPFSGWLNTSAGPLILIGRPILRSDGTGPPAGLLIMARRLDPARLSTAVSVLPSEVVVHGSAYAPISDELLPLIADIEKTPRLATLVLRDADMSDFRYFRDINGQPAFMLEIRMPRSVLATARETIHHLSIVLLAFGGIIFLLLIALIRQTVSVPLGKLADHIHLLRTTGEFRMAPGADSGDEIGTLARSFNELTLARQKAEAELRALAVVAENAGEAIAIFAADNTFAWVNPVFEQSRCVKRADLVSRRPHEVIKGLDDPATYRGIVSAMQTGKIWRGRIRTVSGDGRILTEDVVVSAVYSEKQSAPTAFVMVLHDVSEQIALEARIAQTRRLEAVEQLAAGIAHEINTPAQYVDGNVRFLDEAFHALSGLLGKIAAQLRTAEGDSLRAADIAALLAEAEVDYLQAEVPLAIRQTLEGVGRIGGIVQSLKDLTDPAPDFVPANLNPIIEAAVGAVQNEWAEVAEFGMALDPALPWVPCQPEVINQAVTNMLINAAQAVAEAGKGRSGRGHIVVSTCSSGNGVEIGISDDGIGIEPSVQARMFDPFFTTRPVGTGMGQGLSIAHSVIRRHGGTIAVESTPGRGSSFRICLPLGAGRPASGGHENPELLRDTGRLAG
ncbi:MAG: HAMP domain-containing protein [Gammaproteobacteria bacterium]|nr:HAMP domain-containing protein [Gammaproteobacteria bacterium]